MYIYTHIYIYIYINIFLRYIDHLFLKNLSIRRWFLERTLVPVKCYISDLPKNKFSPNINQLFSFFVVVKVNKQMHCVHIFYFFYCKVKHNNNNKHIKKKEKRRKKEKISQKFKKKGNLFWKKTR